VNLPHKGHTKGVMSPPPEVDGMPQPRRASIVEQPKKPLEDFAVEVQPSALPDPEAPQACDIFYYIGKACCKATPGFVRGAIESKAPPEVTGVKGGIERTCGLLVIMQLLIAAAYVYFFNGGYSASEQMRFLSLTAAGGVCENVLIGMSDVYQLDDAGYWDTSYEWAFGDTMLSGAFVDFKSTLSAWTGNYSKDGVQFQSYSRELYMVFDTWNNKWQSQASVDNLMSMVVAERKVAGYSLLLARVVADPKAIMDSSFVDVLAINTDKGSFPMVYNNLGDSFLLSAKASLWAEKLPKWKFMDNLGKSIPIYLLAMILRLNAPPSPFIRRR
jgi:hypothetical protein